MGLAGFYVYIYKGVASEFIVVRGGRMSSTSDANDVERMRRELIKSVASNWDDVVKIYGQDPRAHKIKLGESGNTALHVAVTSGQEDIVEQLVKLINERSENALDVLSIKGGDLESNPLHLAASLGSIRMCKCIIGDQHKQLLGTRNCGSATPMYMAVLHDLAFEIIRRLGGLMDSVSDYGDSPLHVLARSPTAFRSGISLSFFHRIIHSCIYVEDLIPETFKEKKKVESLCYPNNYQTCINFFQVLWKMIKLLVTGQKSVRKSNKRLDAENPEEEQGHHSSTGAQGRQVFPSTYDRCLNFFGLILSKLVDRSIMLGSREIRTLKEIKETHVWSVQIMNKLLEHAVRSEPQNDQTSEAHCYSEYEVFKRGKAFQTPILVAAANGVIEMVEKILQVFPMTIHDKDNTSKNIVLVAVERRQSHIYDFLLRRRSDVVDKDLAFRLLDKNMNSALHIAAKLENLIYMPISMLQLQWEVKWYEYVKNTLPRDFFMGTNNYGKIPLQIFTATHGQLLDKSKEWLNSTCNSCSFIAALISTVAFASSATVPGGVNQDTGEPIFQHHLAFRFFAISSLVALCSSFISLLIFFAILSSKYDYKDFSNNLPRNLILGLTSLFVSIAAMLLCFCSGHFLMLDDHLKYAAIPIYALTFFIVTYFVLRQFPSYFVLMRATFKKVPQRRYLQDPL
ncbi:uncharacterized protein LOC104877836 isoform X3 [Vitis vinifera]|uniref:uncharacterized protein LOC104877836 isoform X3 n=1 Tax=Vitis vinifera TaxID=29760 RepID=UPI002882F0F7|nr:uncharacterized protein LOC104877836 isoform X3 [Vitis vinifera]